MSAWKLFSGESAPVSTAKFHADRERAAHLEDPHHFPRLRRAADLVRIAAARCDLPTVSDLGCGDGGLLSLLPPELEAWGYDFTPANSAGWLERGVKAELSDVFGEDRARVRLGVISVVTEVLEHLSAPAEVVRWIRTGSRFLVASSPWIENARWHDECHAWAFDPFGYRALFENEGWRINEHHLVGGFQVLLLESR